MESDVTTWEKVELLLDGCECWWAVNWRRFISTFSKTLHKHLNPNPSGEKRKVGDSERPNSNINPQPLRPASFIEKWRQITTTHRIVLEAALWLAQFALRQPFTQTMSTKLQLKSGALGTSNWAACSASTSMISAYADARRRKDAHNSLRINYNMHKRRLTWSTECTNKRGSYILDTMRSCNRVRCFLRTSK